MEYILHCRVFFRWNSCHACASPHTVHTAQFYEYELYVYQETYNFFHRSILLLGIFLKETSSLDSSVL